MLSFLTGSGQGQGNRGAGSVEVAKTPFGGDIYALVVGISDYKTINDLQFADDIDLMGETVSEAQDILVAVHQNSERHGLEINREKTKVMLVAKEPVRDITISIDNQKLEQVSQFKYLGTVIA